MILKEIISHFYFQYMNEYEFYVKVEGYKESRQVAYGNTVEEAHQNITDDLNKQGFMNIQYIIKV